MKSYNWTKVLDELDICTKLLAVWVILKGGKMVGRIVTRYSKTGSTTFVTLELFGWAAKNANGTGIFGHERMSGWGYDRTGMGIAEILKENREKLKEDYGIELNGQDWEIQNRWEKDITAAGYDVIRAI